MAAYDAAGGRLLVALGMEASGGFVADAWRLDVASAAWSCVAGCAAPSALQPAGPGPLAFAAFQQARWPAPAPCWSSAGRALVKVAAKAGGTPVFQRLPHSVNQVLNYN